MRYVQLILFESATKAEQYDAQHKKIFRCAKQKADLGQSLQVLELILSWPLPEGQYEWCPSLSSSSTSSSSTSSSSSSSSLGPGRPPAGGPRMDRRVVTSSGVVNVSRLASHLRRSARRESNYSIYRIGGHFFVTDMQTFCHYIYISSVHILHSLL